jgi:Flp pilus assembly protein CpaB
MKPKSLMLLAVAATCGLVAMIGVQKIMSGGNRDVPKVRILVAVGEIDQGVRLDETNVGFKEWPRDGVPEGAVTAEEQYTDRALKHRVGPGQPILLTELGNKGEYGLEIQIPPEMRVVTIPVTATMTHSGLLRPGNFVDVSAAIETPIKGGGQANGSQTGSPVCSGVRRRQQDRGFPGIKRHQGHQRSEERLVSRLPIAGPTDATGSQTQQRTASVCAAIEFGQVRIERS